MGMVKLHCPTMFSLLILNKQAYDYCRPQNQYDSKPDFTLGNAPFNVFKILHRIFFNSNTGIKLREEYFCRAALMMIKRHRAKLAKHAM